MNTKTMRLPPRRGLTSDKRKESDGVFSSATENSTEIAGEKLYPPSSFDSISRNSSIAVEQGSSNQLILAGYLSHEFLINGTLFGEQWNPVRSQAQSIDLEKVKQSHVIESADQSEMKRIRYTEVANLLREDGAHFAGIVNPTQLDQFLKL